jgi:hypothetical protein
MALTGTATLKFAHPSEKVCLVREFGTLDLEAEASCRVVLEASRDHCILNVEFTI